MPEKETRTEIQEPAIKKLVVAKKEITDKMAILDIIDDLDVPKQERRKLYFISEELLKNLIKNRANKEKSEYDSFSIKKTNDGFEISTRNLIQTDKYNNIKNNLNNLNKATTEEIKRLYLNQLDKGSININKGGMNNNSDEAGLGFLDMAKRSKTTNPFIISSSKTNDKLSVLKITVKIVPPSKRQVAVVKSNVFEAIEE